MPGAATESANMALEIDGRPVGTGHPAFVIAEIGSNHNGELELAYELIDAAANAGVDAVKFQTFRAEDHYSKHTPGFSYLQNTDTFSLIESLEIDRSWHALLMKRCADAGVTFLSSPCDADAIDELTELGMAAYKIASFDLPDADLIGHAARAGKPMILSTGMADWDDILTGVTACRAEDNDQIVLLQCTSLYPAPPHLSNLRAMSAMSSAFGTVAGYSDHTEGDHIALAAVAMGASVIEKHFTLDRQMKGPDHPFAIEPAELASMMARLRDIEAATGDGRKEGPRSEEKEMFEKGRRSLHANRNIAKGETVTRDMLTVKRPGLGISPALRDAVVGRTAKIDIEADHWITWDMI
jgi:sialic acid synthase SpsE